MKTDIYINNFVINEYILTLSKWERTAERNEKKITSLTWELRSKFSNYYQFRWVWRRLLIKYKWSIWGRRIVCWVQWKDGGFLLWLRGVRLSDDYSVCVTPLYFNDSECAVEINIKTSNTGVSEHVCV